ncbi:MAG TPA: HEAT repeat domain-containing protein [Planctomycetota bacterium]
MDGVWRSIEEPGEDVVVLRGRAATAPASFERYYARVGVPDRAERRAEWLHRTSSFAFSSVLHLLALTLLVEFVYLATPLLEETILTASFYKRGPAPEVAKTEPTPQPEPSPQKEQIAAEAPRAAETPRPEASTPAPVIGAGALQGEAKVMPVGVLEAVEPIPESDLAQFAGPGNFEHRSGASRSDAVGRYGGNLASEAAVELGLKWLMAHQSADGRWSPADFYKRCPSGERCGEMSGPPEFDHGVTGLALLAFLGAGYTHTKESPYKEAVALGLQWLLERQDPSGFFFDPGDARNAKGGMYGHGIATFALGEAASMTRDEKLLEALRSAVIGIEAAQQFNGGWYYTPDADLRRSEFTLSVWQMMGLKAAEKAGVTIPERVWTAAKKHLIDQQALNGGFRYSPGSEPTIGATGAGVFARCMLGLTSGNGIERGLAYLETDKKGDPDPSRGESWQYLYAWYYKTLSTFQVQGKAWRDWNRKIRPFLVSRQHTRGHAAGSWTIVDYQQASPIYGTAMCVLMLETYYRYLPMAGDRSAVVDAVASAEKAELTREEERRIDEVRPPSDDQKAERRKRDLLEARGKLASDKPEDRYIAARRLVELGDKASVRAMMDAAKLETGRLRAAHLLFLGRLKSAEAVPFLLGQLDDLDGDVRGAAMSALTSITGVYIMEESRWRDWWRDEQKRKK